MQNFSEFFKKLKRNSRKIFYRIKYLPENISLKFLQKYNFNSLQNFFKFFFPNFHDFVETLLKFSKVLSLQTSIKFFRKFHKYFAQMFRKCFQNYCRKSFSRFRRGFDKICSSHFHNYFNSPGNVPKILCKNSFFFRRSSATTLFLILLKSRHIIFTKLIKCLKNLTSLANIFHKFFKVTSQISLAPRKVAKHVSSFPSAVRRL